MTHRAIVRLISVGSIIALLAVAAQADQRTPGDPVQSLSDALQTLARRRGVQILFRPDLVEGKTAPAIGEDVDADQALIHLLAGSRLSFLHTGDRTYAIVASERDTDRPNRTEATLPAAPSGRRPAWIGQTSEAIPELIVFGTPSSGGAALQEQQAEIGVTNILSSDRIERTPAGNVADLSALLPGLTQHRDEFQGQAATGEGQYITIRGFDTSYNAYSLNGLRLAQTDAASRAVSVNLFSPFAVDSIKVDKTPAADKDGDSIAGIVDFRTPSPFDYDGRYLQMRSQGQWAEQAANTGQKPFGGAVQIKFADRLDDNGRFGLYAAAYGQSKNSTAEEIAAQNAPVLDNDLLTGTPRQNYASLAMNGEQWNFYRETIDRTGGNVTLGYRGDTTMLQVRTLLVSYTNLMNQDQQSLRTSSLAGQSPPSANNQSAALAGLDSQAGTSLLEYNATSGAYAPYGIQAGHYWQYNEYRQSLLSTDVSGQTRFPTTGLTLDYGVGYSYGEYATKQHYEAGQWTTPYIGGAVGAGSGIAAEGVTFDLADPARPVPNLSQAAASYLYNPSNAKAWNIDYWSNFSHEGLLTVSQDAHWAVGQSWLDWVKTGLKYETSRRISDDTADQAQQRVYLGLPGIGQTSPQQPPFYLGQGPTTATFPGSTLNGFLDGAYPGPFKLIDADSYKSLWATLESANPTNRAAAALAYADSKNSGSEQRLAGYLEGLIGIGGLTLLPGVRYEYNTDQFKSFQINSVTGSGFVIDKREYGEVLPGLSATWRPDQSTVLRASIRESYARPAFDQLYGASLVTGGGTGQISITEPNPTLKPVQSTNYDLGFERYDHDGGLVQIDAFYKSLRNVIFPAGATNTSDAITGNVTQLSGNTTINTTLNGREGYAIGLEGNAMKRLSFAPDPLDGLALGGNVTLQASRASYALSVTDIRRSPLPGTPRLIYNLEMSYEKYGVDAALDYSYAGLALQQIQTSEPDIYTQPVASLNLSLAYSWAEGVKMGFSVQNLLDSDTYWATYGKSTRYLAQGANNTGGYIQTGRIIMANWSCKF